MLVHFPKSTSVCYVVEHYILLMSNNETRVMRKQEPFRNTYGVYL